MKISELGLDLIKHYEGLRLRAYQCTAGVWTIGYGHTQDVQPYDVIDERQANIFLRQDVAVSENEVKRLVNVPLIQHQFDALVSLSFNIGNGNFKSSTLLEKLNAGDYTSAAAEFPRWVYAAGKRLSGLVGRREAEKKLFLNATFSTCQ